MSVAGSRTRAPEALRWTEPFPGGALVVEPYLLTTAVLGGPEAAALSGGAHTHADALLAWPHLGPMTVHTPDAVRHLVPGQGLWLPPGTPHACRPEADSVSCFTYVTRKAIPPHRTFPQRVRVGRALQEMLLHLDATAMPDGLRLRTQRVVLDMLEEDPGTVIEVPVPEDRRIRALAEDVMRDPESGLSLEQWAARHALSVRTVTRAFVRDVGMPFARWRSLVRMSLATGLLARGHGVNLVAHRCGYTTTSAFSAAFRRVTGVSPTEYLRRHGATAPTRD
ncbi:AraC family transcriptional regulator [Streptomyces sp. NPDC052077]|uniref:helix-turn-helix domain-containing protein n=1 Tax=Streptomyces sp. NPDC052077 TaxID=3154757 RepID=UPI00344420E2